MAVRRPPGRVALPLAIALAAWAGGQVDRLGLVSAAPCEPGIASVYGIWVLDQACPGGGSVSSTATYHGTFTAYAFGNLQGASGNNVDQGEFANHSASYCPNDPAAHWNWGTFISMDSPTSITLYDENDHPLEFSSFQLEDSGDSKCTQSDYWVDIYQGRYIRNGDSCVCDYVSGSCIVAHSNSCDHASSFTPTDDWYEGPQ